MAIYIALKSLKTVVIREAKQGKGVPLTGNARKQTAGVVVSVRVNFFHSKIVGHGCQYYCTLRFM